MDIGLLTGCLAEVSLPEVARWAAENGFRTLEIPCAGRGNHWHDGAHLVPTKLGDEATDEIEQLLTSTGLSVSALSYCANMLDPDEATRGTRWHRLADVVRAAGRLRVPVVTCRVGCDPANRVGECIATWARLAEDVIRLAEEHGVRLAIENDPMCGTVGNGFEDIPGNLAFSPELWEKLFTHAHNDAVGLCFDPSHLHWLGVDIVEAVTAYVERIYHVRAQDAEVFRDRLSDCSVLRPNGGWWRHRLPGLGEIAWPRLVNRLQENGYDGPLVVAHNDPVWTGAQDRIKRGLVFSRGYLDGLII
jgi:sugar phosphate isomerase/epimerase